MKPNDRNPFTIATRRQLLARGYTPRALAASVHSGRLIRVRRGYYASPGVDQLTQQAVRVGGLLTCVSAADRLGIWVLPDPFAHVFLRHEASRMRAPRDRFVRLADDNRDGCELHWSPLIDPSGADMRQVGAINALGHIIRCQPERLAIAALDSALYEGIVTVEQLNQLFAAVPAKYRHYRERIDARAMSGIETIVRLMMLDAGLVCEPQVRFDGVGTVDLVVEGCVVIETDGRKGHVDEPGLARDYDRDAALAAHGYIVLRFNYRQVMFRPEVVMAAVRGALRAHRRAPLLGLHR